MLSFFFLDSGLLSLMLAIRQFFFFFLYYFLTTLAEAISRATNLHCMLLCTYALPHRVSME